MDQPARKRRKTTSPGQSERESSPLKKPPRRPSFASPTKASLARFNPNLLPRRSTSPTSTTPKPTSRGDILTRGQQARAYIFGEVEEQPGDTAGVQLAQEERAQTALDRSEQRRLTQDQNVTPRARKAGRVGKTLLARDTVEEEDLPATPSRRVEEQDTPRRGVLFSSPSKRPTRLKDPSKAHAQNLSKEDPSRRLRSSSVVEETPQISTVDDPPKDARKCPDPQFQNRKREKAALLRELDELEKDVVRCTKEIRRFQDTTSVRITATERNDIVSFLNRIGGLDASPEKDRVQPISSLLCSFLPFSAPVPPPRLEKESETLVASHRPIDLDDPLPYLQMFTSLAFTSRTHLPKIESHDSAHLDTRQQLHLDICAPSRFLTATVEATLETSTHQVTSIETSQLSSWANRELGAFIRKKGKENDLAAVCWAIGSYWEMSRKRAEYRHKCEVAFANLIPGRTHEDIENGAVSEKITAAPSRKELLKHLGRDVLVLEDRHILVKITWRIGFDWTGEAESEISIEPAFPRVWTETGDGESLKKIPETFNSLLQRSGAFEATRTIVALLFSD